jgi:alkanesulfonate monooxygenase SsuD/methylene tetrahydromethanopterin reductase-like flavin-dependent oxidoreductase (luciferase family)
VSRGSFIESYPLFGFDLNDYDSLFAEKLDLSSQNPRSHPGSLVGKTSGRTYRARCLSPPGAESDAHPDRRWRYSSLLCPGRRAWNSIIGGEPRRFRPLIDLYRETGRRAGDPPEALNVSIHSIGFLADTTAQAANEFYPAYAQLFNRIGKERGGPPITPAQFDAARGSTGALLVGDPDSVAEKILSENEALGGISRMTILLNGGMIPHSKTMHAIELLGTQVAPIVKKELVPVAA